MTNYRVSPQPNLRSEALVEGIVTQNKSSLEGYSLHDGAKPKEALFSMKFPIILIDYATSLYRYL